MDLSLLRRLTRTPRRVPLDADQHLALQVLSDEWIHLDRPVGLLLAERLQDPSVTEDRALDLDLDPGLATCDLRTLALRDPELPARVLEVAAAADVDFAVRLLSWVLSSPAGAPLHGLVANHLDPMLLAIETGALDVEPEGETGRFRVSNGWAIDVCVRQHEFGRIDAMENPEGFEVLLIDYARGPLTAIRDYRPPTTVAHEVYGLGLRARRSRRFG